jgi:hypothetical protein
MMVTKAENTNPANKPERKNPGKDRIPMSIPQRHLEVAEIPGYHTHWFLGSRVPRALRAGYTFVTEDDGVELNNFDLAGDAQANGSTDLGTRFSVPAAVGGDSDERLYLMKLPTELWEQDQAALEARNEVIAATLRGGGDPGMNGGNPHDTSQGYVPGAIKQQMANMFMPKRKR